jgi:protoporphyrinogen oxidase
MASKRRDWSKLDGLNVHDWIVAEAGETIWNLLWKRSFDLKFYELSDSVAAPWLGARIKRLAASRRSILQEELGYIDGGTEVLVEALVKGIVANRGKVLCREPVQQVEIKDGKVVGARTPNAWYDADHVISTMAIPYVTKLIPGLPDEHRAKLDAIRNIGVVCVVLKLGKSVTPHFWVNINDQRIDVPGIVEFSNLRPTREHVVYVPFYMPQSNPKFVRDDCAFIEESKNVVRIVNPDIRDDDFVDARLGRLRYAQPVCEPGFGDKLPADPNTDPGTSDRRHKLLLSRGPRRFGERSAGEADGGPARLIA